MQGDAEIIEVLNEVLTAELTAVNQYFLHGKLCGNWGFARLAEHSRHESIDEMKHAERITDRIIYFEGFPNYQRYFPLRIGETVPEQFEADLASRPRRSSASIVASSWPWRRATTGPGELLADILVGEEEHVDWIETQLEAIRQIGLENYLAQQLHDD